MSTRQASLREALSRHERARGRRYPQTLEKRVVEYARARRAEGTSWTRIASELGMPRFETVRRWVERTGASKQPAVMRAVKVVPDRERRLLTIVSPSGVRIEGVTLDEAVAVLRALG